MAVELASDVRVEEETAVVRRIAAGGRASLALAGISERGPIGVSTRASTFAEWNKVYGGYTAEDLDVVAAIEGYFDNGGTDLFFTRIVHTSSVGDPTTKTSAAATLDLLTAAASATPGTVTSAVQPYNLEPSQTLVIAFNLGGDQTFTFAATAATRTAANNGPYNLDDLMTFQVAIDGGPTLTKTFSASEFADVDAATVTEVLASLNAFFASQGAGAVATVQASAFKITSNRRGTGSGVNIVGGTANAVFGFTTGNIAGTGDVSNIDAVTAAEVNSKLSTLTNGTSSVVAGAVQLTSTTTGTGGTVQVKNTSTAVGVGFDNAVHAGSSGTPTATLTVDAKTDGEYGNAITVQVIAATSGEADRFNLYVLQNGVVKERYFNVTMDDADPLYVEGIVNDENTGSDLIQVVDLDAFGLAAAATAQRPAVGTFGPLTGGDDGLSGLTDTDYSGGETVNGSTGLRCFDPDDIDILVVPGRATSAVHNAMITYCEVTRLGRVFAILDPPAQQTAVQIVDYVETTAGLLELSDKAAIYWPRVKVANPDKVLYGNSPTVTIAPSGHIAGVYARNDARKIGGQFEQPAGIDFGIPRNVLGLEQIGDAKPEVLKKAKRDIVFPKLINPISRETGPIFIDGARTLKSTSPWSSVGSRRGIMFMEKRLVPGLAFMRHRNINDRLYREGERTIDVFMLELTAAGCFKSLDPKKAFFVDLGKGLNTAAVQAQHRVVARIGVATSEIAEFVLLLIAPDTRALDEELAALAA